MIASLTSSTSRRIFSTTNVNFYHFPLSLLPDIPAPAACPLDDHLECPARCCNRRQCVSSVVPTAQPQCAAIQGLKETVTYAPRSREAEVIWLNLTESDSKGAEVTSPQRCQLQPGQKKRKESKIKRSDLCAS